MSTEKIRRKAEQAVDDAIDRIREKLKKSPLGRAYVHHLASRGARNTLPWHALAEREYWALVASFPETVLYGVRPGYERYARLRYMGSALTSRAFLWSNKAQNLCLSMPDLPPHEILPSAMPFESMFFSREAAGIDGANESNAVLMYRDEVCLTIACDIVGANKREPALAWLTLPWGATYPDSVADDPRKLEAVSVFLKMLAFVQSKVARTSADRLDRPSRRRCAKAGHDLHNDTVTMIELRAMSDGEHEACKRGDGNVEWNHHWWVRGHWRNQWHPSDESHELTWIHPYIKGDRSQPLKENVYHVNR